MALLSPTNLSMYVPWRLDPSNPNGPRSTGARFYEVKPLIPVLDIPLWAHRFLRYRVQLLGKCIIAACTCRDWVPDIVDVVAEEYLNI